MFEARGASPFLELPWKASDQLLKFKEIWQRRCLRVRSNCAIQRDQWQETESAEAERSLGRALLRGGDCVSAGQALFRSAFC